MKRKQITDIDEQQFLKKVESSNCMSVLHPENFNSVHATVHTKFDFEIEDGMANEIVPQIADAILMSEISKLIRNEYVIEVYGNVIFYPGMSNVQYNVTCMRPVLHNLPFTLSEEGWQKEIDAFAERLLQEYKQGF